MAQLSVTKESKSAATIRRRRHMGALINKNKLEEDVELYEDPDQELKKVQIGPPFLSVLLGSEKTLFLGLLAFRFINALMIQTSFVPDEYWQSIEVAHRTVFGYGYLTWEWRHGLRGYTYPTIFTVLYKGLGMLRLDYRLLLIKVPRIVQAVFAAIGDVYLFKLSRRLCSQRVALWSLICQLTSWFTFYCATRTLTNSMETVLTTMALFYFPWPGKLRKAPWKYVCLMGLAVVVRPTALIIWTPLCMWHIWTQRYAMSEVIKVFTGIGFIILLMSTVVDFAFYGRWVNVHYNFLEFNVLSNLGAFYGSHAWHWYITQGFAVIMGTHLFPFLLAVRNGTEKVAISIIAWTVFVYSFLEHKEFRFLMPILPMAMHVCGRYLHSVCDVTFNSDQQEAKRVASRNKTTEENTPQKVDHSYRKFHYTGSNQYWCSLNSNIELTGTSILYTQVDYKKQETACLGPQSMPVVPRHAMVLSLLLVTNLPLALYTSLIHQRGTVDVMKFLHDESFTNDPNLMNILFLMPCHSTPYYSYLHRNVSMRFLTCEPNLSQDPSYVDEADVFYQNPATWLELNYPRSQSLAPSHLVMFDVLQPQIREFLETHGFLDCGTFFHTHLPEGRVGSHVNVLCTIEWKISRGITDNMRAWTAAKPKSHGLHNQRRGGRGKPLDET